MTNPYYATGDEMEVFRSAYTARAGLMIIGPTGCGKTRLVQTMADEFDRPLVTVTCHDDLTTSDLLGRYLVRGGDVTWIDGPLTRAVREGAICYLDEVIEARRDTLAALHSLSDHRRTLFLERTGEVIEAPPEFFLVASHNPRARGAFKELKASFRQRVVTVALDYAAPDTEVEIVAGETGIARELAARLVAHASAIRAAAEAGSQEAPSTRVVVVTASLIVAGLDEEAAVRACMLAPLSPDAAVKDAALELIAAVS